jgi:cytochrome P450
VNDKSEVTIDFDHHRPEFSADRDAAALGLQKCPVAWTHHHDGYWVFSKYDDIFAAGKNARVFSSANDHGNGPLQGLNIPFVVTGAGGIIESDAPRHAALRKQMTPWFSPTRVQGLHQEMEDDVTYFVDQFIETGSAELVNDLIGPFPGLVTMRLLGVPVDYYERFAHIIHRTLYVPSDAPERAEVDAGMAWIAGLFVEWIEQKRADPKDDYLSFLATMELDGELLSIEEVMVESILVIGAGLDTTTALMGHSLRYLSAHPEEKKWLADDPTRLHTACEEFLRVFSPINATARTVTEDTVVRDLQLMWHAGNRDADAFECPQEVRLDRDHNRHLAFAAGPHRCIGAHFARAEWRIVMNQMIERLPDFTVDEAKVVPFPDVSITAGFISMPIEFTPGPRRGNGILRTTPVL